MSGLSIELPIRQRPQKEMSLVTEQQTQKKKKIRLNYSHYLIHYISQVTNNVMMMTRGMTAWATEGETLCDFPFHSIPFYH